MIKYLLFLLLCIAGLVIFSSPGLPKTEYFHKNIRIETRVDSLKFSDGPYILIDNDSIIELNIINGNLNTKTFPSSTKIMKFEVEPSLYHNVERIAALSDLHGQYDLTIEILTNNGVIDTDLKWNFGTGHLVIVGDIFDRGEKVTELLWFVYNLEKQALASGGKVHFLLGNHEYMVMQNDLRYINKKYRYTEHVTKTPYNILYSDKSLLGRWLRSKNTIEVINDNIFVHGGISQEFIENGFDLKGVNDSLRQSIHKDESTTQWDSIYGKYHDFYSPVWYRGYFTDSLKKGQVNKLLKKLDVKHIIVGHTSQIKIESLFDNRIFGVDSSIKNGLDGEILFIENGTYYRGKKDGEKIKFD
ncbi:MAG: metallophosphoesterase [Flavobacteriaceae bacterium]